MRRGGCGAAAAVHCPRRRPRSSPRARPPPVRPRRRLSRLGPARRGRVRAVAAARAPARLPACPPPVVVVAVQAEEMRLGAPAAAAAVSPPAAAVSAARSGLARGPLSAAVSRPPASTPSARRPARQVDAGPRPRPSPARVRAPRPRAPPSSRVPGRERQPVGTFLATEAKRRPSAGAGRGQDGRSPPGSHGASVARARPSPQQVGRGLLEPGGRRLCNFVRAVSLQKTVPPGARGVGCAVAPCVCAPRPATGLRVLPATPSGCPQGFHRPRCGWSCPEDVSRVSRRCKNTPQHYKRIISYLHLSLNYLTLLQRETVRICWKGRGWNPVYSFRAHQKFVITRSS